MIDIMEREKISVNDNGNYWRANNSFVAYGPTARIAVMRCFVATHLGSEVEVPDELVKETT